MTKRQREQLMKRLERVEGLKKILSDARDKLRAEVEEMDSIIESMTEAEEALTIGLESLKSGLDHASEYV